MPSLSRRQLLTASGLAALGLAGCSTPPDPVGDATAGPTTADAAASSATPKPTAAAPRHANPLLLEQTKGQASRSLRSLEKLDDHPLWSMSWQGSAAEIDTSQPTAAGELMVPGFACTLWVATGKDGQPVVGRNWDWDHGPGLTMVSETTAARTLTLTDLTFLGLRNAPLDDLDEEQRTALLRAQGQLVEGVNEHGVFIGLAADNKAQASERDDHPMVGGLGVQRLILDQARTVEDAIDIFKSVDLDFTGGPGLHYLVADAHGGAAALECDDGQAYVETRPPDQPWFCLENFHMAALEGKQRERHNRWSTCAEVLGAAGGVMSQDDAFGLLETVRQRQTQWSTVYDLAAGTAVVRTSEAEHSLSL